MSPISDQSDQSRQSIRGHSQKPPFNPQAVKRVEVRRGALPHVAASYGSSPKGGLNLPVRTRLGSRGE